MIVERVVLAPASDPFDAAAVYDHARVDHADQKAEMLRFARAAAAETQIYASLALLTQTIRVTWTAAEPRWRQVALPIGPVLPGATAVVTAEGEDISSSASLRAGRAPILEMASDATEPQGRVVVEYPAGFGASASDLPPDLAAAIMDQAATWFDARGLAEGVGLSPHLARVAARYRPVRLGWGTP